MHAALEWEGAMLYRRAGAHRVFVGKIALDPRSEMWCVYLRGLCVAVFNRERSARLGLEALVTSS
jgi:hypothetical protein